MEAWIHDGRLKIIEDVSSIARLNNTGLPIKNFQLNSSQAYNKTLGWICGPLEVRTHPLHASTWSGFRFPIIPLVPMDHQNCPVPSEIT